MYKTYVLEFIEDFEQPYKKEFEELFFDSYSYYFVQLLNERFSKAGSVMFLPETNRFYFELFGNVYSIFGEVTDKEVINNLKNWSEYCKESNIETKDIIKKYILKLPDLETIDSKK